MAKTPNQLFKTPAIGTTEKRINQPQRDAYRTSTAPKHKEAPLLRDGKLQGTNKFRGDLEKELNDKWAKDPNAIFSLSDLKKQYGEGKEYDWDSVPYNKITQDGETYFYGQNAKDLDKRIADFKTPYENKLYDRFGEFGYDDTLREVYDSISKRNTQGGGEFDEQGNYKETNPHAFPELYYGKDHILRKIRELKADPRNRNIDDKELLKLAVENAQIDFDELTELPYTRKEWEQMTNEQWDENNPKYRGGDPWDNMYNEIYDKYEAEGLDPSIINQFYDWSSYSQDDDYLYKMLRNRDNDEEYSLPAFRFRKAQQEQPSVPLTWDEYYTQNPGASTYDFLSEVYDTYGPDPDRFGDAVRDAEASGNVTYAELANALYDIDPDILYGVYDDILGEATNEAVSEALNTAWDYYGARRYLEKNHPYIDSADVEELLEQEGLYSDERIQELIDDIIEDWRYDPGTDDLDDIVDNIRDELYNQYNVEVDDSVIEDYLSDQGYRNFDIDDFTEWLLDEGTNERNADRTIEDILLNYGGKEPQELWDRYIESLTNPGGYSNIPYRGDLSQWYGRDFASWANRSPKDIRNWYARRPEEYGTTPGDFIEAIDEAPSFRKQVQTARQLVDDGVISEKDAILYLTSYTNLWQDGLLSARAQEIIEEEWNKADQKSKALLDKIPDVKEK